MAVTQTGPLFRLDWEVSPAEAIEITRTVDAVDTFVATVESGTETFVDTVDTVDVGTVITWTLVGVDSADSLVLTHTVADVSIPPLDDDRRFLATLMVGSRLWHRMNAPLGVTAGGGDFGPVPLSRFDPDVQDLLVGLRRSDTDLTLQTWPTVDEFRAYVGAGSAYTDDQLAPALDSAILVVRRRCRKAGMA